MICILFCPLGIVHNPIGVIGECEGITLERSIRVHVIFVPELLWTKYSPLASRVKFPVKSSLLSNCVPLR